MIGVLLAATAAAQPVKAGGRLPAVRHDFVLGGGDPRAGAVEEAPAGGQRGRVPERAAGLDHRQQHARQQAADRLSRRHAGGRAPRPSAAWPPINLVANTGFSPGQRCNVIMVRADAPKFKSPEEAIKWLDGKQLATPQGSCAHRFLGLVIERPRSSPPRSSINPSRSLRRTCAQGKIDAAVLWEPSVSRIGDIVGEGSGRIVATGHTFGIPDAGAIAMREDFMKSRPDLVEAWLKTELEAQQSVIDRELGEGGGVREEPDRRDHRADGMVLDLRPDPACGRRQPDPRREAVRVRAARPEAARGNLRVPAPGEGDRRRQAGARRARRFGRAQGRAGGEGDAAARRDQGARRVRMPK